VPIARESFALALADLGGLAALLASLRCLFRQTVTSRCSALRLLSFAFTEFALTVVRRPQKSKISDGLHKSFALVNVGQPAAPFGPTRDDCSTGYEGGTEMGRRRGGFAATLQEVGNADLPRSGNPGVHGGCAAVSSGRSATR
jgi:hypothetical protein